MNEVAFSTAVLKEINFTNLMQEVQMGLALSKVL
jgi:hypothetical protein